jgi:hypothetical protein
VFAAQSQAWDMALQYYAMLHRRAKSSGDLATSLQPITDFLAYRHRSTKAPPGSRSPAPSPEPSPAPAPAGNGAPSTGAFPSTSPANGGTPPATHS